MTDLEAYEPTPGKTGRPQGWAILRLYKIFQEMRGREGKQDTCGVIYQAEALRENRGRQGKSMIQKRVRLLATVAMCLTLLLGSARAVEQGYTVFHGDREKPAVALTVDDCYDIERVTEILNLCQAQGVPVTFFVVGSALRDADTEVWLRALELRCEIGNHTWSHPKLPELDARRIQEQLSRTQTRLDEVLGGHYPMQVMRPPYGSLAQNPHHKSDGWVVNAIAKAGYLHAVRWDVSQTDPDQAMKDVENGSILLYHANAKDVRCLEQLIPTLREKYACVTVSELLGLETPAYESAL